MQLEAFARSLTDLFFLDGRQAAQGEPYGAHRARLLFEMQSGRWVLLTAPDNLLWGFMSWYRVDAEVLALLKAEDLVGLARHQIPHSRLDAGAEVYLASAIVPPWSPRGTYFRLWNLVRERNADARAIHGVVRARDGRSRWVERRIARCH